MIKARNLHKTYGDRPVLRGIDLDIVDGEVVGVIGPSGGGKSTLLRCLDFLEIPDQGTIEIDGAMCFDADGKRLSPGELARRRSRIGFVFQSFNLFPHMTALQNVASGPRFVLRQPKDECDEIATTLLTSMGLGDEIAKFPEEMSGGQQQRVAIARALAMKPTNMLFDEPTSALDPELVGEVLDAMRALARTGTTMVIVTHEMSFIREIADRVLFLADGIVVEQGTPDQVFMHPRQERTQEFLSRVSHELPVTAGDSATHVGGQP